MPLPPLPGPDTWTAEAAPPDAEQAWRAGPWRIAILPPVPSRSLRRLSLSLSLADGAATSWHGLSEILPPAPVDPHTLDALLQRHRLRQATPLLAALVALARDVLARRDAPEGEMRIGTHGVAACPWPLRLDDAPLLLARPGPGWAAFLPGALALGTGPDGGIAALSGRHLSLAPARLTAHDRAALVSSLPPDLLVAP
jgi:hypothetical protein